jgi:hypothetical protein
MPELCTIYDYMRAHANLLGARILEQFPALHQVQDPPSPRFEGLLRRPFPAQAIAIMGLAKRWRQARTGMVVAECGTGKTLISLGAIHVHSEGSAFTALAMVPPHLVSPLDLRGVGHVEGQGCRAFVRVLPWAASSGIDFLCSTSECFLDEWSADATVGASDQNCFVFDVHNALLFELLSLANTAAGKQKIRRFFTSAAGQSNRRDQNNTHNREASRSRRGRIRWSW